MTYVDGRLKAAKAASRARRAANKKRGDNKPYRRVRARPIEPGMRYMVTRRTLERRMFLLPDNETAADVERFLGYTLGVALMEHGQQLHAVMTMSNHHHTNVTDVEATLPAFKNTFHAFVARGINARRGRFDGFWSADPPCDVQQLTDEETLKDIVYTYTNPVEAGLVKRVRGWPGFSTYGWKFGEVRRYRRPAWFYDPANPDLPESVEITLVRPDIFPELSNDALWELIQHRVGEREREIHAEMAKKGRRFMGTKKLMKQRWNRAAKSREERFTLTPKVSSTCKWARIAHLERNEEWERDYAAAREKKLEGKNPLFPYGTYWMGRFAGARVAAAP